MNYRYPVDENSLSYQPRKKSEDLTKSNDVSSMAARNLAVEGKSFSQKPQNQSMLAPIDQ